MRLTIPPFIVSSLDTNSRDESEICFVTSDRCGLKNLFMTFDGLKYLGFSPERYQKKYDKNDPYFCRGWLSQSKLVEFDMHPYIWKGSKDDAKKVISIKFSSVKNGEKFPICGLNNVFDKKSPDDPSARLWLFDKNFKSFENLQSFMIGLHNPLMDAYVDVMQQVGNYSKNKPLNLTTV